MFDLPAGVVMVVHLVFIVVVAVGAVVAVRCHRLSWLHVSAVAEMLAPKAAPGPLARRGVVIVLAGP